MHLAAARLQTYVHVPASLCGSPSHCAILMGDLGAILAQSGGGDVSDDMERAVLRAAVLCSGHGEGHPGEDCGRPLPQPAALLQDGGRTEQGVVCPSFTMILYVCAHICHHCILCDEQHAIAPSHKSAFCHLAMN
jgi:hypothetical protein